MALLESSDKLKHQFDPSHMMRSTGPRRTTVRGRSALVGDRDIRTWIITAGPTTLGDELKRRNGLARLHERGMPPLVDR